MPFFVLPFPIIDPVAVHLGPAPIRWYALAYIGGFICAWIGMRVLVANERLWRAGQPRPSAEAVDDLLVYARKGTLSLENDPVDVSLLVADATEEAFRGLARWRRALVAYSAARWGR